MEINHANQLVSVIIPSYNYARFLQETLENIRQQSYTLWECIVVDDGSTDNTREVVQKFSEADKRIRYIYQTNRGLSAARNTGIKEARGNYIQLLDADDLISSNKFVLQLEIFHKNPETDIVYGNYLLMEENGKEYWKKNGTRTVLQKNAFHDFLCNWEKGLTIPIHCFLFRKSCFDQWGYFDTLIPTHEDLNIQLNFALHGANYTWHPEHVAIYRIHHSSMAKERTKMHRGYLLCLAGILQRPELTVYQKLLTIHRYIEEVSGAVLQKITGVNLSLWTVLNDPFRTLNLFALLLFIPYATVKISSVLLRRAFKPAVYTKKKYAPEIIGGVEV